MYKKVYNNILKVFNNTINRCFYKYESDCDDVHHIKEQARANKDGFIEHINANHKYNLIPLCKEHHKMVHDGSINVNGFVATSNGLELHYTMVDK